MKMIIETMHVEDTIRDLSYKLEEAVHRIYNLEDGIAQLNAIITDLKESKDA
jgi:hypothetical protein